MDIDTKRTQDHTCDNILMIICTAQGGPLLLEQWSSATSLSKLDTKMSANGRCCVSAGMLPLSDQEIVVPDSQFSLYLIDAAPPVGYHLNYEQKPLLPPACSANHAGICSNSLKQQPMHCRQTLMEGAREQGTIERYYVDVGPLVIC